jgi:putative peptidoglycan lipid II flippase
MSFAKSIATVSGLTMLSRVTGFIRDVLTAQILGAGMVAEAFFVAQRLPNLFRSLFAEGAFNASFVPLFTAEDQNKGREEAIAFASESLSMLLAVLLIFSGIMILLMPQVMTVIAPGFLEKSGQQEDGLFHLAVTYGRITFPYLALISLTALQGGILNGLSRFGGAAGAPVLYNLVMIAALLSLPFIPVEAGLWLSVFVTLAGVVQMVWLAILCRRAGVHLRLSRPRLTPRVRKLFALLGPGAVGAGAMQINLVVSTMLASTLPLGAVSYLYYADRLNQLPLGVIGIAISTTLLPVLSRHVQSQDLNGLSHHVSRGIEFGLTLALPATVGLMIAAHPIIAVLFQRGAFGAVETAATAAALRMYAVGIPAFVLVKIFSTIYFAHQNTKTPVRIAMIAVAGNVLLALALIGPLAHLGLALATGLATWINVALLVFGLVRQKQLHLDARVKRNVPRLLLASTLMGGVLYALLGPVAPGLLTTALASPHFSVSVLGLLVLLLIPMGCYFSLCHLTGVLRLSDLGRLFRK